MTLITPLSPVNRLSGQKETEKHQNQLTSYIKWIQQISTTGYPTQTLKNTHCAQQLMEPFIK